MPNIATVLREEIQRLARREPPWPSLELSGPKWQSQEQPSKPRQDAFTDFDPESSREGHGGPL